MEKEFILVLNRHPGILYKVCRVYCPDEEDRKDLFQEIVLQLWQAFPAFRREANPSTWMYRIALNTAISNFRKQTRKPLPTPFSHLPFPLSDFADETAQPDEITQLYAAIDQLSTIEKALVMLYLDEKSYEEMAVILGISKSNVGVKLNRVRSKLEKLVQPLTD
ncbi:MAG: RNA polymerase sigma factor [Sphingobacteriaceae bacterium]|nr:RNA polymerase sigma factor [Cytophagaceae bacterium]